LSELFGTEFHGLLVAVLRRVRLVRARRESELRSRRRAGAPRGAFAGHRAYTAGDDVRHLDWSAYARTGELFLKVFEEDVRRGLTVLLDASRSMGAGEPPRWDGARRLAALFGALALVRLEGLRLVTSPDEVHSFAGAAAVPRLLAVLESVEPADTPPADLARVPIERSLGGSLCWIGDFAPPDAFARPLRALRATGRICTGVLPAQRDDRSPAFSGWVELVDPEAGVRERVRVDRVLKDAVEAELELLARQQDAVFTAAGQPLYRFPLPDPDDFRVDSWLPSAWLSSI
jgi:uncharacterized protein (DUF58 family)